MGNQSSNNGESKNESIKNSNDISIYYLENLSIYKGMKTESNSNAKSDSCSTDKATTSTSIPEKRFPIRFEWKEGGSKVLITGSFINWNTYIEMKRVNQSELFQFNFDLPKGVHQFKFIVDGVWKTSNFYPKTRDNNGNENNVIDLTEIKDPEKKVLIEEKKVNIIHIIQREMK